MKKLMIAVAAAAMIGAVEAAEYVYDFSATLTTTAGKEGKAITTTTTHKIGLGQSGAGKWWYNDDIFTETADGKFKTAVIGGEVVNALKAGSREYPWKLNTSVIKTDAAKQELAEKLGYVAYNPVEVDAKPRSVTGTTRYDYQKEYRGKDVWCETFSYKYTVTTPAECYRDAGKVTIKGTIVTEEICLDDPAELYDEDGEYFDDFEVEFLNFFGSQVVEKATKVEGLFTIGDDIDMADGTNYGFALAGQGKYDEKLLATDEKGVYLPGISSISGNIVGYLPAPDCEACCADEAPAVAFECGSVRGEYDLPTAAYGSWSMKFNKKLSSAE
jgi:hypothetical protein